MIAINESFLHISFSKIIYVGNWLVAINYPNTLPAYFVGYIELKKLYYYY